MVFCQGTGNGVSLGYIIAVLLEPSFKIARLAHVAHLAVLAQNSVNTGVLFFLQAVFDPDELLYQICTLQSFKILESDSLMPCAQGSAACFFILIGLVGGSPARNTVCDLCSAPLHVAPR